MTNRKVHYVLLYIVLGLLAVSLAAWFVFKKPYTFQGTVINPPLPVENFALQTKDSETLRLSDMKGKFVLLFFGYTSCPDVCPITLSTFKQVYERLGENAQHVEFVMITADPERDTPEKLASFVERFNPKFIGLSGDRTELEVVWKELGVYVEKQDSGSAAGYMVSHTSSAFVLNPNGNLVLTFPYGTTAIEMTADLNELLKQSGQNSR